MGGVAVERSALGRNYLMIFGYLDAGSGSLILQAILGGAAGILVAFKAWRARLMGKRAESDTGAETEEPAVTTES
jgi:hypothetical protein